MQNWGHECYVCHFLLAAAKLQQIKPVMLKVFKWASVGVAHLPWS